MARKRALREIYAAAFLCFSQDTSALCDFEHPDAVGAQVRNKNKMTGGIRDNLMRAWLSLYLAWSGQEGRKGHLLPHPDVCRILDVVQADPSAMAVTVRFRILGRVLAEVLLESDSQSVSRVIESVVCGANRCRDGAGKLE